MYEKSILDNGLKVISYKMIQRSSVGVGLWVKGGSRFEVEENQGVAHFLEHLFFKGSKHYSCRQIKQSIEGVGGSINGFTSEEFCCYFVKIPYKHLSLALDILIDMILNPLLLEDDINKERNVVLEEIKLYHDLPQNYVHQLLDELLWPNHPLGRSILGTYETINSLRRKDILLFKENYYFPSSMVIAACGNLEHKELLERVKKHMPSVEIKKKINFQRIPHYSERPKVKISKRNIEQIHLALGFHGVSRTNRDRYALSILHIILGANMSSRLFNEVREKKGLAYDIGTHVQFFLDSGSFVIHAGIDPKKIRLTLKVIIKELEKISNTPPTLSELKRAKDYYLGQLSIFLEDTLEHMLWLGENFISLDKIITFKEIEQKIQRISTKEIMFLAKDIFIPHRRKLALVGPIEEEEKQISDYISKL
ncbi:MAG: insulinase family protein [Candidatus Omnitrophica bacterium]|nr:insulinase family protein [Candidatus Omnitrophota bacterium]